MVSQSLTPRQRACAVKWLIKNGRSIRLTKQRVGLAHLLIGDGQNRHVTAEGLYQQARQADMNVSRATIYNALRDFCASGLMQGVMIDGKVSYYDTCVDHHAHFYLDQEDTLVDIPMEHIRFAQIPRCPPGTVIERIDVVIRLSNRRGPASAHSAPPAPPRRGTPR